MKSSQLTKYLEQLERTEDQFAMEQPLDSSTWNIADARAVANFYSSQLAYAKAMIKRTANELDDTEQRLINATEELSYVRRTIEEWKSHLFEAKTQ